MLCLEGLHSRMFRKHITLLQYLFFNLLFTMLTNVDDFA